MIKSFRHTGIVVRDLEKAANFYRSIGFVDYLTAIERSDFIDQVTGLKNANLEWIKLKAPDGYLLELLKYHSHNEDKAILNQSSFTLGISHIAFTVEDIDEMSNLILMNGGSVVNPPALSPDKKVKVLYCHDLEGVLLEIVEELS